MRKSVMAQDALTAGVDTTGSSVAFARAAASASSSLIPAFSVLATRLHPGAAPVCLFRAAAAAAD